jgi:hypothetical protein
MQQRGRKSAELQALPEVLPTRPEPPPYLAEAEAVEWVAIVGRMPATWFTPEMFSVLGNHCCHICLTRELMEELREVQGELKVLRAWLKDPGPGTEVDSAEMIKARVRCLELEERQDKLIAMHLAQSKMVSSTATKLRLTPQSRYQPDKVVAPAPRKKPWD